MFVGLGFFSFSCHRKVYFTDSARLKLTEAGDEIAMLQFFNDKEVLLHRKTTSRDIYSDDGVVKNTEGNRVVYLRIRRRTPCRIDSIAGDRIYIRFEDGEGNRICFYKNTYDHYQIYSPQWVGGRGSTDYNLRDFVIDRTGNDCLLMVENNSKYRRLKDRKVAKGLRVDTFQGEELEEEEEDIENIENPENDLNEAPSPKQ